MKKIYQTIVDKNEGNCMQATIASLLDKTLDEIPELREKYTEQNWFHSMFEFLDNCGYKLEGTWYNKKLMLLLNDIKESDKEFNFENQFDLVKDLPGVNGYFFATVFSPIYHDFTNIKNPQVKHAVIIDKYFNIVHDPNPLNKGIQSYPFHDLIGYNGVCDILLISKKIQKYSFIKKEFFGYSLLFYWEDNNGIETIERFENFVSKDSANRKIFQVNDEAQAIKIINNKKELKTYI